MKKNKLKAVSIDELIDQHIGQRGTDAREAFENELKIEVIAHQIKQARKERNLTQEQLGELVGVQKAQISRIENSATDARLGTILRIFQALGLRINFNVEFDAK